MSVSLCCVLQFLRRCVSVTVWCVAVLEKVCQCHCVVVVVA